MKKMLSKKLTLSLLIAMMIISAFPIAVHSDASIGVEVGDWFVYNVSFNQNVVSGTTTGLNAIGNVWRPYFDYTTYTTAYQLNRTVTGVDTATGIVNFTQTYTYLDGHTTTSTATANVSACNVYWQVIPSGLVTNDTLGIATVTPPRPSSGYAINNTFARTYDGGDQTTCNMSWYHYYNTRTSCWPTYYWDQTTGILAYQNFTVSWTSTTAEVYSNFYLDLVYTNAWSANTIPDYDLDVVVSGQGSTDPAAGTYSYPDGTVVNVTATPSTGYRLANWTLNTVNVGSDASYIVLMNQNHTLTATFIENIEYNLTVAVSGSGSVNPDVGTYTYFEGDDATVTASESVVGWVFDHWLLNGTDVGSTNPYTLTMDAYYNLTAVFVELPKYTLTIGIDGSGSVDPAVGTHQYYQGLDAVVTASDIAGWAFDYWLLNGTDVGSTNPYTLTMDTYYNLTAVFVAVPQHELTIAVTGSGSTDPAVGTHMYNENNTAVVTAVESVASWLFDHWVLDTVDAGSANPISVLMNETHSLTAVFVEAPVTIGVEVGDWFAYDVTVTRETNATAPDIPNIIATTHDFIYDNNFTSLNRTVTAVYGTTVEFTEEWAIANGTVLTNRTITANVAEIDLFWVVIPAGLEADDNLTTLYLNNYGPYPQGGLFYINETLLVEYLEENRETCSIAYDYQHTNAAAGYNCSYQWDQATGILVGYNVTAHWTQPTEFTKTNFLFQIKATNRWVVIPEFPTTPVTLLIMFIALAASIEIFRRKKL